MFFYEELTEVGDLFILKGTLILSIFYWLALVKLDSLV